MVRWIVGSILHSERERNVLFNDALNTFYLRLYGVRHMVKDHSDSEKGNPLPPHRLLLSINSKGSFICTIPPFIVNALSYFSFQPDIYLINIKVLFYIHHPTYRIINTTAFITLTPVVCNKGRGMCYPVCAMVHIKDPLLLIGKSNHLVAAAGFFSRCPNGSLQYVPTPYNRKIKCAECIFK